jgi:Resolvase, N terminal domain
LNWLDKGSRVGAGAARRHVISPDASRTRPDLTRPMREIERGDVLVPVRFDRLACSVCRLLDTIERGKGRAQISRSLRGPIDTPTARNVFSLQVLGAVAQLEILRALVTYVEAGPWWTKESRRIEGNSARTALRRSATHLQIASARPLEVPSCSPR